MSLQPEKGDACKGEVGSSSSKAESSLPSDPHLPNNRPVQKNRKRCWTCRSKLELVQQEVGKCRCGQWLPRVGVGGGGGVTATPRGCMVQCGGWVLQCGGCMVPLGTI